MNTLLIFFKLYFSFLYWVQSGLQYEQPGAATNNVSQRNQFKTSNNINFSTILLFSLGFNPMQNLCNEIRKFFWSTY